MNKEDKGISVQTWTGLKGSRKLRLPDFKKVVRLSALRSCRLYSSGNISGTHLC